MLALTTHTEPPPPTVANQNDEEDTPFGRGDKDWGERGEGWRDYVALFVACETGRLDALLAA